MPRKLSNKLGYCLYAVVSGGIAALSTLFLTWKLTGQIQWVWVFFITLASSSTYITARLLEMNHEPNQSVIQLNRLVREIALLRLELASQLQMSQSAQEKLGRRLSKIESTLKMVQTQTEETRS